MQPTSRDEPNPPQQQSSSSKGSNLVNQSQHNLSLLTEFKNLELCFRRGLKRSRFLYLTELKQRLLDDWSLRSQVKTIDGAFSDMESYIRSKGDRGIDVVGLHDFRRFGLSDALIQQIGNQALRLDNIASGNTDTSKNSPELKQQMKQQRLAIAVAAPVVRRNNPSKGFNNTTNSSTSGYEESYEEDFEEILDEDDADGANVLPTPFRKVTEEGNDSDDNSEAMDRMDSPQRRRLPRKERHHHIVAPSWTASEEPLIPNHHSKPSSVMPSTSTSSQQQHHQQAASSSGVRSSSSVSSSQQQRRRKKTPDWITHSQYRLVRQIGEGSFGSVFEAITDAGIIVAVKKIAVGRQGQHGQGLSVGDIEDLLGEIDVMRHLQHPNIVMYLGAVVDSTNNSPSLLIFQEWVSRGSLAALLKDTGPFSLPMVRNFTRQILIGLAYLHEMRIVHRDIKGGNILVHNEGLVKLADFGASKRIEIASAEDKDKDKDNSKDHQIKGTPYFMAPEVVVDGEPQRPEGDIWAVGCTMVEMLTAEPPWKKTHAPRGFMQLRAVLAGCQGPPPLDPPRPDLTPEALDLLRLFFLKSAASRPSAASLLLHPFLREGDVLDESMGSAAASTRDIFEESGTLTRLRDEIKRAVASDGQHRQQHYAIGAHAQPILPLQQHNNNHNQQQPSSSLAVGSSDLIGQIDQRLRANQLQQQQQPALLQQKLPAPAYSAFTPRTPEAASRAEIQSPPIVAASGNNPFGRSPAHGQHHKNNHDQQPQPQPVQAQVQSQSSQPQHRSSLDFHAVQQQQQPSADNNTKTNNGNNSNNQEQRQMRDSLQVIKRKASQPKVAANNNAFGIQQHRNSHQQSSARDSEEQTPPPREVSSEEGEDMNNGEDSNRGSESSMPPTTLMMKGSDHRPGSKGKSNHRYDANYFEAKYSDAILLSRYSDGSPTASPTAATVALTAESYDDYDSGNNRLAMLRQQSSSESIVDEVQNDYYHDLNPLSPSPAKSSSNHHHNHSSNPNGIRSALSTRTGSNPSSRRPSASSDGQSSTRDSFSSQQPSGLVYMASAAAAGTGPSGHRMVRKGSAVSSSSSLLGDVNLNNNNGNVAVSSSQSSMRKSASTSESLARPAPLISGKVVPRLSGIDRSSHDAPLTTPSNKAASARAPHSEQMAGAAEAANRPFTSKAALASAAAVASSSSTAAAGQQSSSSSRGAFFPSSQSSVAAAAAVGGGQQRLGTPRSARSIANSGSGRSNDNSPRTPLFPPGPWQCLSCDHDNRDGDAAYCDHCATVRGSSVAQRGVHHVVRRL